MSESETEETVVRGEEVVARTETPHPREVTVVPAPGGRFSVPCRHNHKLSRLADLMNEDMELQQLWRSANINAIDRSGINDHGPVHIQIIANIGLRLLRLLTEAGVPPSVVADYGLAAEDAEIVVVLGLALHDIGISIHREDHEHLSVILAAPKARALLAEIYREPELTILVSEVLHAVVAHHWEVRCLTVESGVVKVADALDIAKGRSRIPYESGIVNIHSVSAAAIDSVTIKKGATKPISIVVRMNNPAGIYQLDELLKRKLRNSSIPQYVEISAILPGERESQLVPIHYL